jgi:glycosyltransferase involved in cell wall biosynthesis
VPNGVDLPADTPRHDVGRGQPVRILFVGLHSADKGIRTVLESTRVLRERGANIRVLTLGEWPSAAERRFCEEFVQCHGLSGVVEFGGLRAGPDKWRAYAASDIFFFPTRYEYEIMPLVVIEAMACGLPVVATRWRGIPDLVRDGQTGFLVESGATADGVERIEGLVRDAALRAQLGAAGRERYLAEFTVRRYQDRMADVFLDLAGRFLLR